MSVMLFCLPCPIGTTDFSIAGYRYKNRVLALKNGGLPLQIQKIALKMLVAMENRSAEFTVHSRVGA